MHLRLQHGISGPCQVRFYNVCITCLCSYRQVHNIIGVMPHACIWQNPSPRKHHHLDVHLQAYGQETEVIPCHINLLQQPPSVT